VVQSYRSKRLDGFKSTYKSILNNKTKTGVDKLNSKRLGKTFAAEAVRVLSRFDDSAISSRGWIIGKQKARLAVVGLMVKICDSARIKPVHDAIARDWNNTGAKLPKQLMYYVQNWLLISSALVAWKRSSYKTWNSDRELEKIGITSQQRALEVVHLC